MDNFNSEIERMVDHFRMMAMHGSPSMVCEVREQYLNMANGGDGGYLGYESNGKSTCRDINYPGYPDWFFQKVVERMEWQ